MPPGKQVINSLEFQGLQCTRGERDLFTDLSATITSGQCLHVVGANGSGKTSLLRILCGLNSPDSGTVSWNNEILSEQDQHYFNHSRYIGHKDALKHELTAIENLRFYQRMDSTEVPQNNDDLLDDSLNQMQILQCADLLAQHLSFGQRRRLAFARLLLRSVDLWILDEPFTGIDKEGRALIEDICLKHLQNDGMIVLTHHLSLANSKLAVHLDEIKL